MKKKWDQIIDQCKKNDRISFDQLHPGATDKELLNLEKALELTLPDSFKTFYEIHNGWREWVWPHASCLLSSYEIIDECKSLTDLYMDDLENEYKADAHSKEVKKLKWNKKWIPFTKSIRGRDFFCLDFDPSEFGTVGQIIFFSTDLGHRECSANSFEKWIDDYIVELSKK